MPFSIDNLREMLTHLIENRFSAHGPLTVHLLTSIGSWATARGTDWADVSAYECDFKGYAAVALTGGDGGFTDATTNGLKAESEQVEVNWAYDSGESGADTLTSATHVVLLANPGGGGPRIEFIWELPAAKSFTMDGDAWTFNLRIFLTNVADVA